MSWKSYDWRKSGCRIQSDTIHPEEKRNNWGSKISPLIEKLEPYIKPYITKIDDAVGQLQRQISQAVQKAGGVVDDTFRLEPVAGDTIETLGKEVVQESGEAACRRILHEESGTVETIQAVATDEIESRLDSGLMQSKIDEIINTPKGSRPDPSTYLNLRIPSGNEAGANSHWVPGGKTDGGVPEAISDLIPNVPNNVTVLEIK